MVSLLFVAFMKPEFAKVFAHTFFHHLFYKDYFHSFINFVSFSPLWRSVVLHICQLHDSDYHIQKQHQSPSSDQTHFPGASVEILRLERFCELREILNIVEIIRDTVRTASYLISRTGCTAHQWNTAILWENTYD